MEWETPAHPPSICFRIFWMFPAPCRGVHFSGGGGQRFVNSSDPPPATHPGPAATCQGQGGQLLAGVVEADKEHIGQQHGQLPCPRVGPFPFPLSASIGKTLAGLLGCVHPKQIAPPDLIFRCIFNSSLSGGGVRGEDQFFLGRCTETPISNKISFVYLQIFTECTLFVKTQNSSSRIDHFL